MLYESSGNSKCELKSDYFDLANIFLLLLICYATKFADVISLDVVVVGWAALVIYALIKIKPYYFYLPLLFYLLLFLAYSVGVVLVPLNPAGLEYGRVILTSLFLSIIVSGVMLKKSSAGDQVAKHPVITRSILYLGLLAIAAWSFSVYSEGIYAGGSVVKEFGGANYLTTADLLAMFSLTVLGSKSISVKENLLFFTVSVIALVLLGSRSSLLVFFVAYFFCLNRAQKKSKFLLIFFSIFLVALVSYVVQLDDSDIFSRFKTLYDLGGDESLYVREALFSNYIATLRERPECLVLPCIPDSGNYVHSILSIHQYFGIVGLLGIAVLFVFALIYHLKIRRVVLPGLLFYVSIGMFFSRAWVSLAFPVFIGFLLFYVFRVLSANRVKPAPTNISVN